MYSSAIAVLAFAVSKVFLLFSWHCLLVCLSSAEDMCSDRKMVSQGADVQLKGEDEELLEANIRATESCDSSEINIVAGKSLKALHQLFL